MLTFPSAHPPPPPRAAPAARHRQAPKVNRLLRTLKLNSLAFLKFPKSSAHASGTWRHSHLLVISYLGFILTSVNDASSPRAREHLRSCLHLTNPCTKRKFLSPTKPKGKIYKTKSLGHYITFWDTNRSFNLGQTTGPYNNQQKKEKRTCRIVDFAVPFDHKVKMK